MTPPAIEVERLAKVYTDGTVGLSDITFAVEEAEAFGLIGPNGAGKSTTIRILVTLLAASSGSARVGGYDVNNDADHVRRTIGYAGQSIALDRDLTVHQNLLLQARLHGMPKAVARARCWAMLDEFSLAEVANRRTASLSGGMRRRLELVQALVHRPAILFLDEPTTGLDPTSRARLWAHLAEIRVSGTTVFLTTQYLEEADRLCDRVAIVDGGRLVASDTPESLKALVGSEIITLEVEGDEQAARAGRALADFVASGHPIVRDGSVSITLKDAGRRVPDVIRALDGAGVAIGRLVLTGPTLDDVFAFFTDQQGTKRALVPQENGHGPA